MKNDEKLSYVKVTPEGEEKTFTKLMATDATLRDYFAVQAMQALIIGPDMRDDHYENETNYYVSERAYLIAEAMLRARK